MTARKCFTAKMAAGKVLGRPGQSILETLDQYEAHYKKQLGDDAGARKAAQDTADGAEILAARAADLARAAVIAQANVLRSFNAYSGILGNLAAQGQTPLAIAARGKRTGAPQSPLLAAVRSLLVRDPHEIATWANVDKLADFIRGRSHSEFAGGIETLRPKTLGFRAETLLELDALRALYGRTDVDPNARAAAESFSRVAEDLREQFVAAGGSLPARKNWRLPNPWFEASKVRAAGSDRFKAMVRERVDRADMLDFDTGLPLTDAKFEKLLDDAYQTIIANGVSGLPSSQPRGNSRMLANSRAFARLFSWKDAESWTTMAESFGAHSSPYQAMLDHIEGMALDVAMMRVLGPNPDGTARFILSLFDREAARLMQTAPAGADSKAVKDFAKINQRIESQVARDRQRFENLWAEINGSNNAPVNVEFARVMSDVRSGLVASQMGSAIISSITDTGTLAMTSRFNGMPAMNVLARATAMMGEKGSEIFAAQQGLIGDSIAMAVGRLDKAMGETIRTGAMSKISSGVIRASGLRRWSATLRNAFGLEYMAHVARERGKGFADLDGDFREALSRYGIDASDWDAIRGTTPHEPRPNAHLLRPMDVENKAAGEKLGRLISTEMDYAVIERDAQTRALLIGDTRPGTAQGEFWRAVGMYKSFPTSFMLLHFSRAFARGFDGKRMTHGALTFIALSMLGALAMQAKHIVAGREPRNMDPTSGDGLLAWGGAILQGGGLGVFGDMLLIDQTRYGNSWAATIAGPQFAAVEAVLGDFLLKNFQKLGKGEPTQFAGDALYTAGRYMPGSNLWYARLAFQRGVLDQAALMIDPRARDRFQRMERTAERDFGQHYFWKPGQLAPEFAR